MAQKPEARPVVGAIRWDAWSGGPVTAQVERTLGPKRYHDRLPWFAEVIDDSRVRIDGGRQETMDREIDFAADAGLDYWAFLLYPEADPMSRPLQQYLESARRKRINFSVILHNPFGVPDAQWPRERDRVVALLKEPGYQTVLGGRPLVYAFAMEFQGAFPTERFAEFRRAAKDAGLDPYYVFMGWNPARDFREESPKGFDAVSAYACGSHDATYDALCRRVEKQYWANAAAAGVPYIPLVTTGWDKRPRKDHPVSWEIGHSYHQQAVFPSAPTPQELASHLSRALAFIRENPKVCAANAVVIYAWNEYDEGGWLAPTRTAEGKANGERLEAVRLVLKGGGKQP